MTRTEPTGANNRYRGFVAQYEYGPFGEVIRITGPISKANPFRFSTKYQDDETDLLYYGYRYYCSLTGRWLSRDPLEESEGANLFEFNANCPVNRIDADGRCCCCCAEWISIEDIIQYPTFWDQAWIGHSFNVKLGMYYPGSPGQKAKSCTFRWREKTDLSTRRGEPENAWYNVLTWFPDTQQATAWDSRKQPCGGTETLPIPDKPVLARSRARNVTRHLQFEFILESAPGCSCSNKSVTKTALQTISMEDGNPVRVTFP